MVTHQLNSFLSAQSISDVNLEDRISGSLFGLLLCDSLGAAVEGQPLGSFDPVTTLRGGGKFQLKPGQFTDDGSMALCLAVALLGGTETSSPSLHPSAVQMNLYRRWYESGYLSSTGECFDIGITVRTAINRFTSDCNRTESSQSTKEGTYYGSESENASGNGSLMRLAPVPLLYHRDPQNAIEKAILSSKTTHASRQCLDSCRVYTILMIGALQGATKEKLLNTDELFVPAGLPSEYWTMEPTAVLAPSVKAVMAGSYKHHNPPEIKASGFVVETLEAALWAFYHTESFEEGALKAVNLGNDADTVGAIYGMLAGAYYGIHAIPTEWRKKCSFQSLVQTIADEIFIQAQQYTGEDEKKPTPSPSNRPSFVYRNVLHVYNELTAFYSGTIKRRVLPCPKQYKCAEQFDDDIKQLQFIYENIFKSVQWCTELELKEATVNADRELMLSRSDSILKQFLELAEEDKRLLTMKWSRNSAHLQVHQRLTDSISSK